MQVKQQEGSCSPLNAGLSTAETDYAEFWGDQIANKAAEIEYD